MLSSAAGPSLKSCAVMRDHAGSTWSAKQRRLIAAIVRERRKAFQRENGRGLSPGTLLFEPEAGQPADCNGDIELQGSTTLRNANLPAHFLFAYDKTGLMVTAENITQMSLDSLRRWDAAIAEYFQCERQGKAGSTSRLLH